MQNEVYFGEGKGNLMGGGRKSGKLKAKSGKQCAQALRLMLLALRSVINRFLRLICRAFELDAVAIGVEKRSDPHAIADKRFACLDAAFDHFFVKSNGVIAGK